jgi:predicted methyltransferase
MPKPYCKNGDHSRSAKDILSDISEDRSQIGVKTKNMFLQKIHLYGSKNVPSHHLPSLMIQGIHEVEMLALE